MDRAFVIGDAHKLTPHENLTIIKNMILILIAIHYFLEQWIFSLFLSHHTERTRRAHFLLISFFGSASFIWCWWTDVGCFCSKNEFVCYSSTGDEPCRKDWHDTSHLFLNYLILIMSHKHSLFDTSFTHDECHDSLRGIIHTFWLTIEIHHNSTSFRRMEIDVDEQKLH